MMACLHHSFLLLGLQVLVWTASVSSTSIQPELLTANNIHLDGIKFLVNSTPPSSVVFCGDNATLSCQYWYEPELSSPRKVRIKWSWLPASGGQETDVLVAIGVEFRSCGDFRGRVHLRQDFPGDASLVVTDLQLNDTGYYRCEVVDGLQDRSTVVNLQLGGVVFPYQHPRGRYHTSFLGAKEACEEQGSTLVTLTQLLKSWREGLKWCNGAWLADGTIQYPVTRHQTNCSRQGVARRARSYGRRQLHNHHRYDVFCFTSSLQGRVYYLQHPVKLNLSEAQQACQKDNAKIANVGQLYAAWKLSGLDHCDPGWLADGSVRYPITRPRENCGPSEPGVRSSGFPPPHHMHGVYCYKTD